MNVNLGDAGGGEEGDSAEQVVAEINITPLTDVFLVLLIIFMVTTTAVVDAEKAARDGVRIALPKMDAAGPVTKKRSDPVLTITKAGELYLFTKKIEANNLEAELSKALKDIGSETLLLRGDKQVMLGSAVDVMSIAKRAGAKNIAILTQPGAK
jgi:biopolymer transport protein ExbD